MKTATFTDLQEAMEYHYRAHDLGLASIFHTDIPGEKWTVVIL